eukprot:8786102-Pyramimonas_sp.AAC.1
MPFTIATRGESRLLESQSKGPSDTAQKELLNGVGHPTLRPNPSCPTPWTPSTTRGLAGLPHRAARREARHSQAGGHRRDCLAAQRTSGRCRRPAAEAK